MTDYFNILGVNANASDDEIKKAYKKLAMQHHPDRGGDQNKFQEIQEAYSTLSDPQKRAQWEQQKMFGQGGGGGNFHHFSFGGGGGGIDDLFRQFAGGFNFRHHGQPAKNADLRVGIELDLESTLNTQSHHINVRNSNGSNKTVEIEIPRGVQTGMQIRYQGKGDTSHSNLPPGDLLVDLRIRQHPEFVIAGLNLIKTISVNCIDAVVGTKAMVSGLDHTQFEIRIPPGTQNNSKFRIPSQGLWDVNQPIRGDLHVEISLTVPSTITSDQHKALENLLT